ncbi:MAG TPA: response regulator transcription factor [Anaerolineaceae bacterium]|nr:response regulator transcription factor [Anaerolineaceae bacterium]
MQSVKKIGILVVDHHAVVSSGISAVLRGYADFDVVGNTECSEDALTLCDQLSPDVVCIDIDFPGALSGVELIQLIHRQHAGMRIIVLTNLADENTVHDVFRVGATSYLLKYVSTEDLALAIRTAYHGQATLSPEIVELLLHAVTRLSPVGLHLTQRESQVLELIAQGKNNPAIAKALNISLSTVQFHVRNILSKLDVHNRIEAATSAVRHGMSK